MISLLGIKKNNYACKNCDLTNMFFKKRVQSLNKTRKFKLLPFRIKFESR